MIFDEIKQLPEPTGNGRYSPTRDPGRSMILVAYMKPGTGGRRGFTEVLCSQGLSWEYACYGDREAEVEGLAWACEGIADGLYVLEGRFIGSGEDVEYDLTTPRALTDEEREYVLDNSQFEAVAYYWAITWWADVPCRDCGKLPGEHKPSPFEYLACPGKKTAPGSP